MRSAIGGRNWSEEGEDESFTEQPPKRAGEDAPETTKPNESGSGLMDKFAKEFKVSEKCGPAFNEELDIGWNVSKHELHRITSVNPKAIKLFQIWQWDAGF